MRKSISINKWDATEASARRVRDFHESCLKEMAKVIVGQRKAVGDAFASIFGGAHFYLESAPGLGKTLLLRTMRYVIADYQASMLQCTVDMLPTDVTGFMRFDEALRQYVEQHGYLKPTDLFLLVDEFNRASGKVQATFLRIMAENELAIGNQINGLDDLFVMSGTCNPVENRMGTGTTKTIEALADRWAWRSTLMYGTREDDRELSRRTGLGLYASHEPWVTAGVQAAMTVDELRSVRAFITDSVVVPQAVSNFISEIVRATRPPSRVNEGEEFTRHMPKAFQKAVLIGCSARAIQSLNTLGKTRAAIEGRLVVTEDDIEALAPQVCAHRLILDPEALADATSESEPLDTRIIAEMVRNIHRPVK